MSQTKHVLPFLETMITQACNLSCLGCTNYSDIKHSGYQTWDEGKASLTPWLQRLEISDFGIIGGEPLINPQWREWVAGIRGLLPTAQIRFTTNGLLLHKHPDIVDFLQSVGNVVFKITVHQPMQYLDDTIDKILTERAWEPVFEFGIRRYRTSNDLRFQVNRPTQFIKTYQGSYQDMRPWDSDPARAFEICCQKTCPLLYQGRIYKCSTAGLLKDTLERFGNPNLFEWQSYLDHGIGHDDDDSALSRFVDNFGKPSSICGQCPSGELGTIDHTKTVWLKNQTNP